MKTYKQILEDSYASDYKVKKFLGPDGKWQERKLRPHRVDFKNSKMRGEPVQDDDRGDVGMKEEKSIEVTMKSGHKFTAPIKVSSKDWHIVKHPTSGKQYRVDHKGNTLEEGRGTADKHWNIAQDHKEQASLSTKGTEKYHSHMADYHDSMHRYHSEIGQSSHASAHADKAEIHHEKAYEASRSVKESTEKHELGIDHDEPISRHEHIKAVIAKHGGKISGHSDKSTYVHFPADKVNAAKAELKAGRVNADHWVNGEIKEETMQEQAPVAPVPDRKYIKGTPEHKAYKATKKPINGMPTNMNKEEVEDIAEGSYDDNRRGFGRREREDDEYHVPDPTVKNKVKKVQEVLSPEMGAGEYIKDFQKSDAPQFKGKTQEKRRMMGIAAYMAAKKDMKEEAEQIDEKSEQAKRNKTMKNMMDASRGARYKVQNKVSADDVRDWDGKHPTPRAQNVAIGRALRNEAKDETPPFDGPYTKTPGNVKDKSGAVHTPMSRARDLARQAMKKQCKEELDLDLSDDEADALMIEALTGQQHKLDKNKNGKVDSGDLKMLRGEECPECHKAPCECGTVKESGEVETRSLSFGQFMNQLNEYNPGPGGVTRIQGRSYGAQYRDPEGEDDADDKKKQVAKSEPAVKRGRGRPAGSKSGANQKVTTGKKGSGVDYTGYKLHLPNSNR